MKVLMDRNGRYPSISPDGNTVAFVFDHTLNFQRALDRSSKPLSLRISAAFAGDWNPNGRFVLAGGMKQFPLDYRLLVVDVTNQAFREVRKQVDEIVPEIYWVKKRFASSGAGRGAK
jgi:hypothetical protein